MKFFIWGLVFTGLGVLCPGAPSGAQEPAPSTVRRMAVTVDDLVGNSVGGGELADYRAMTQTLVCKLHDAQAPTVAFVNMAKVRDQGWIDPDWAALLDIWLDAGIELGNHTAAHADLHLVTPEQFEADVLSGEEGLAERVAGRGGKLRYFRHPCLHTGRSLEIRNRVNAFLAERGYTVAPVTVDNGEWIVASAYRCCLNQGDWETARRIEGDYLDYMLRKVAYFEEQSRKLFDREVPQVLLIHANSLNAACIDRLLEGIRQHGYTFVPLEEAIADPAYGSPDTFTGRGGISWLHRWALTQGCDRAFFGDEPEVSPWVCQIAGVERE